MKREELEIGMTIVRRGEDPTTNGSVIKWFNNTNIVFGYHDNDYCDVCSYSGGHPDIELDDYLIVGDTDKPKEFKPDSPGYYWAKVRSIVAFNIFDYSTRIVEVYGEHPFFKYNIVGNIDLFATPIKWISKIEKPEEQS